VTKGAIEGAVWGAKTLGVDAPEVAAAAASGALNAAESLGPPASDEVARAASGVIGGVKVVVNDTPG